MKTIALAAVLLAAPTTFGQLPPVPDPPPLERRVSDLERRVALLEKGQRPDVMPAKDYKAEYAAAVRQVLDGGGGNVVLCVGVARPRGEYAAFYEFPSGFKGIADGIWDCFAVDGVARMRLRSTVPAVTARPFVQAPRSILTTPAPPAAWTPGPPPTFSAVPGPFPGPTYTIAPGAGAGGITNCLGGG